ncbi:hypothetical protein RJT34_08427 [Clitoria ternatea]|uniref:Legumain prodomain domain-containing protein n=1 Tax=Clitoria ternatea TaxID=43366 RepID=A0AAN9K704_CLITE
MDTFPPLLLCLFVLAAVVSARRGLAGEFRRLASEPDIDHNFRGTKWAVLLAGSRGFFDYRHQADVCHAYQLLRKGGLKEENIIVFMYDDIAFNKKNPRPGVIINKPDGGDVYKGVPKDYTGEDVNANNFLAVLLGNKSALTGGSGKVLDSGPDDHIFIFYTDHGGPGLLGMPAGPFLFADDLNEILRRKHASGTYKRLVFYIEACQSGTMFEGFPLENMNIYATTAANPKEPSFATYCPGQDIGPPPEYSVCLSNVYSAAWMEDSDIHNLRTETLHEQYKVVKARTRDGIRPHVGSHTTQYGDRDLSSDALFQYLGTNPANDNFTFVDDNSLRSSSKPINQRDTVLIYFWDKFHKAPEGSAEKNTAQKQLLDVMSHRMHIDNSVQLIGKLLFGIEKSPEILNNVRPAGSVLVDDWGCMKTMVRTFETHCGSLSRYGMKHMRSFANICNAGIKNEQMAEVSAQACVSIPTNPWSSLQRGFSA